MGRSGCRDVAKPPCSVSTCSPKRLISHLTQLKAHFASPARGFSGTCGSAGVSAGSAASNSSTVLLSPRPALSTSQKRERSSATCELYSPPRLQPTITHLFFDLSHCLIVYGICFSQDVKLNSNRSRKDTDAMARCSFIHYFTRNWNLNASFHQCEQRWLNWRREFCQVVA